jgi:hypothetical protein
VGNFPWFRFFNGEYYEGPLYGKKNKILGRFTK